MYIHDFCEARIGKSQGLTQAKYQCGGVNFLRLREVPTLLLNKNSSYNIININMTDVNCSMNEIAV